MRLLKMIFAIPILKVLFFLFGVLFWIPLLITAFTDILYHAFTPGWRKLLYSISALSELSLVIAIATNTTPFVYMLGCLFTLIFCAVVGFRSNAKN